VRSDDHASRAASVQARKAKLEEEQRQSLADQSYLKALSKANELKLKFELIDFEEEDAIADAELQNSLAHARRLATEQRARKEKKVKLEPADLIFAMKKETKEESDSEEDEAVKLDPDSIVFTPTTEFCRGLEQQKEEMALMAERLKQEQEEAAKEIIRQQNEKQKKRKPRKTNLAVSDDRMELDGDEDQHPTEDNTDSEQEEEEEEEEEDEEDEDEESNNDENDTGFLAEEGQANMGLAQALVLAKKRGLLKEEAQVGRANDEPLDWMGQEQDSLAHIQIEHLDEFGRVLKPKEAFRKISHTFHGKGPSAHKREKSLRKLRDEIKRTRQINAYSSGGQAPKGSIAAKFEAKKKKTGQAFIVLDRKGGMPVEVDLSKKGKTQVAGRKKEEGEKVGFRATPKIGLKNK